MASRPKGQPGKTNVHDFIDKDKGKVTPYGAYDVAANSGWVAVGTDHDTARFAVSTIRAWWHNVGREAYPGASRLLVTADGGGSNGYRTRLRKTELARFAAETGLEVSVCHLPPGTRPEPASGTKSSTGCSPRSPWPGRTGPWSATKSSSARSPRSPPAPG